MRGLTVLKNSREMLSTGDALVSQQLVNTQQILCMTSHCGQDFICNLGFKRS